MSCCAVATCPNYLRKTRKLGVDVLYHCFPNDTNLSNLWIQKCKRLDSVNSKNARICSDHFEPSDYIDDMKNRLLNLPQKKVLCKGAVPTLKLPQTTVIGLSSNDHGRDQQITKRRIRARALGRIMSLSKKRQRIDTSVNEVGEGNFVTIRNDRGSDHRIM